MKFLDQPTRNLFFTGKGGVGKTSGSSEVLGGSQIEASQRSARFFILKGCQRLAGG